MQLIKKILGKDSPVAYIRVMALVVLILLLYLIYYGININKNNIIKGTLSSIKIEDRAVRSTDIYIFLQ
jgi:hypothetical protein